MAIRFLSFALCACALSTLSSCTSWTSLHAGYGQAVSSDRSLVGVEVRKAAAFGLHAPYALIGARLDAGDHQLDAEGHVGVMRPLRLAEAWTLVPSATLEFARVSYIAERWDGGALGPGLGGEVLWWYTRQSRTHSATASLGCMGGVDGVDCPRRCYRDFNRSGIGLRVAAEHDVRFGSSGHPGLGDTIIWLTLGVSHATGEEREDCRDQDPFGVLRPTRFLLRPLPAAAPKP